MRSTQDGFQLLTKGGIARRSAGLLQPTVQIIEQDLVLDNGRLHRDFEITGRIGGLRTPLLLSEDLQPSNRSFERAFCRHLDGKATAPLRFTEGDRPGPEIAHDGQDSASILLLFASLWFIVAIKPLR